MQILLKKLLLEIDWNRFSDVNKRSLSAEDVERILNIELDRLNSPKKDKEKADPQFARISKGNIPTNEEGRANIQQFIRDITQLPKQIFDVGEKSKHSIDEHTSTINTGIPALRAVLWDDDENRFHVINTCPGAGSCIKDCYAMHGFYIMNDGKNIKLIRRLQLLMSDPDKYIDIAHKEAVVYAESANKQGKKLEIRWNDAGDFFSQAYFDVATTVTDKLLSAGYNVASYAYTKVGRFISLGTKKGMEMSFSLGAKESERVQVDMGKNKFSVIVGRDIFRPFFTPITKGFVKGPNGKSEFRDKENGPKELKVAIFNHYKNNPDIGRFLTLDSLKYTDELSRQQGRQHEFNVIVLPGDSDVGAQRKDVRGSFLLAH